METPGSTTQKEQQERKLPIGIGATELDKHKDTLPTVRIDNEIIWGNQEMDELPFVIRLEEPLNLGMFLTSKPEDESNTYLLEVMEGHDRTGLIGRVIFKDNQGRLYRDIDIKGGGAITGYREHKSSEKFYAADIEDRDDSGWSGSQGLYNAPMAIWDAEVAEKLLSKGIRTYRIIAIVKLQEVVYHGVKISILEAKERGILSAYDRPVIEVRAFGTHVRILDAEQKGGVYIDDALKLVAQELGRERMDVEEYFEWFCKTLGKNLKIMRDNLITNNSLNQKDVTLDCRMVDLDGVKLWEDNRSFYDPDQDEYLEEFNKIFESDIRAAKSALDSLLTHIKRVGKIDMPTYKKLFKNIETWFNEGFENI